VRNQTSGQRIVQTAVASLIPVLASQSLIADEPRIPRVRSENPRIARLVATATERSATFRDEMKRIESTNGVIYIHPGDCGRGGLACLVLKVTLAGPYRVLRVNLDMRRNDCDLIGAIGHELWHAIEALADPDVTTDSRLFFFFHQLGPTERGTFETAAAIRKGRDVFYEACAK
jgi:hypothetical protein